MSETHHALVRQQFDRQVGHYLASSSMADPGVIGAVLTAAPVEPGQRVLDVACGAGFLLRAYRDAGAEVFGVDLSAAMLRGAAETLGPNVPPDRLIPTDAAQLPFDAGAFDVVTCKLALHYFPDPGRSVAEMVRVCRRSGRVALIDRVASDDPERRGAQPVGEARTPNKIRVYAEDEVAALLAGAGVRMVRRQLLIQPMDFEEWMAAAGALDRAEEARRLLLGSAGADLTGLAPISRAGRLTIQHRTLILIGAPGG